MPLLTKPIFLLFALYCATVVTLDCYSAPWELSRFQQELSQLNDSSSIEPSGAKSPGRISLSTGFEMLSLNQDQDSNLQIFPQEGKLNKSFITWSQGLFYPFSYGVSASRVNGSIKNENELKQISANIKWTIFESFGLPAISTQLQWSRMFGLPRIDLQSSSANIQASWGYNRISFFSGFRAYHHRLNQSQELQTSKESEGLIQEQEAFNSFSAQMGIHLQLIPAKLAISCENAKTPFSDLFRAKLAYEF
ncbi:MAG: hypothetical protein HRU09_08725 [Oligoflexales bacterium]|nr:hypothetical protein [Oligoflexales bacterium]